jgi:hypothetical protein
LLLRLGLLLAGAGWLALVAVIIVLVHVELVALLAARLFLDAAALVGENAEIMIRELEIIFGVHPIALALRVACQVLVFLQQLAGIAPRAAVDPVPVVAAALTALTRAAPAIAATTAATIITAATATAAVLLPIVDQSTVLVLKTKTGLAPGSRYNPSGVAPRAKRDGRTCHGRRTAAAS